MEFQNNFRALTLSYKARIAYTLESPNNSLFAILHYHYY